MMLQTQPQHVAGSRRQVLRDTKIPFCCLDGGMAERELNLLNGRIAFVGEFGEGTAQVVGSNFIKPSKEAYLLTKSRTDWEFTESRCVYLPPRIERKTAPEAIPASGSQASAAAIAHEGIGTQRILNRQSNRTPAGSRSQRLSGTS